MAGFDVESLTLEVKLDPAGFLAGVEAVLGGLGSIADALLGFSQGLAEGFEEAEAQLQETADAAEGGTEDLTTAVERLIANLGALEKQAPEPFEEIRKESDKAKRKIQETDSAAVKLGNTLGRRIRNIITGFAAPVVASLALGSLVNRYFSGVAEVARQTGAYNEQMEEQRRKREMLSRITKEDIELYRKGREALARFMIATDRLSVTVMRAFGPALQWAIGKLNAISAWVGANENNIVRFFKALAMTMTALLIPATIKWGLAMLANPITWLVAGLMLLALVIDDLLTYMEGGESLFDWGPWIGYIEAAIDALRKVWEIVKGIGLGILSSLLPAFNIVSAGIRIIGTVLEGIGTIIHKVFEGDFAGALDAAIAMFRNVAALFGEIWQGWCDIVNGFFTHLWEGVAAAFPDFAKWAEGAAKAIRDFFAPAIDWIMDKIRALTQWLPDWAKAKLGLSDGGASGSASALPSPDAFPAAAEAMAAQVSQTANSMTTTNETNNSTTINGVTINTQATDPKAVAVEVQKLGTLFGGGTAAAEGGIR